MTNTYTSAPCAGRNAIEAAVFTLELTQPATPEVAQAIKAALDRFANKLPGIQANTMPTLVIAIGNTQHAVGEAVRFKAKPNGEHAWRVQAAGNSIQVVCADYTRFTDVWAEARTYMQALLACFEGSTPVGAVSHQFIDRFLYPVDMPPNAYQAKELFAADSPYLTPKVWNSGAQWHVYQGWFEDIGDSSRTLHQLNVSTLEQPTPSPRLASIIDHRVVYQMAWSAPLLAHTLATQTDALDDIMSGLHTKHTAVLKQLLQTEKQKAIGMDV